MKDNYTSFLFFTGKGGVGKTSLACATAIKLADEGKNVLLISTDPASNLGDVLATKVEGFIKPHQDLPTLYTINIDAELSAEEYRKRVVDSLTGIVATAEIEKVKEELSGACTTEIASFDEFSRFITGEANEMAYDVVIFDTAPTGHTLRLLELPAAWDTFLETNAKGASCIGPSSALKSSKERYKKVVNTLRDPLKTTFFLVARAQKSALKEAAKTSLELLDLGMRNQKLLINGVFKAIDQLDPIAKRIELLGENELTDLPVALQNLDTTFFPLLPYQLLGLEKLRSIFQKDLQHHLIDSALATISTVTISLPNLSNLVDTLENNKTSGLIMTMGKGGVGKTIVAATIATMLAKRGHQVLLTTTDPAAHIKDFINQLEVQPPTLTVERIDPKVETSEYIAKIVAQKGEGLDLEAKKLLLEDLKSPCTEEVAVFHAFSKAIQRAKRQFVVIDTAPTGHTLLLLDTTGSYHREVLRNTAFNHGKIMTPLMALQDVDFAKILLVSLPETTPMREAEGLQNDLQRAGIVPFAWVINQSFASLSQLKDPVLRKKASAEIPIIQYVENNLSTKTFCIPYISESNMLPALLNLYDK